jgi:Tfp pilus assembly protein PilO
MSGRDRTILGVLAVVAALAGFWFLALAPKRKAITAANADIATQQQRLDSAQSIVTAAESAKRAYPANAATVATVGKAVPADDDVASLVYQLQSVAAGAKVTFKSIKLTGDASSSSSAAPPAATTSGTAAPASQVAAAQLPPGSVVGTAGLATMPFKFTFEGSFLDMQKFLARVQEFVRTQGDGVRVSGRLLTVDGIALGNTEGNSSSKVTATIAATAYLSPQDTTSGTTSGTTESGTATPSTGTPSASTGTTTTSAAVAATPAS